MNSKQIRMLEILDDQIRECKDCPEICENKVVPYWENTSKYAIIGEAPGREEVENGVPFYGKAGRHLWNIMNSNGLYREDFLIINTINCRPVKNGKNGKPNNEQIKNCRKWINKYFHVLKPSKVLILGNYAMGTLLQENSGIMKKNSMLTNLPEFGKIPVILSIHPSMCIYSGDRGKQMLCNSIKEFKEI